MRREDNGFSGRRVEFMPNAIRDGRTDDFLLWILIGVVLVVIIAAFVFMPSSVIEGAQAELAKNTKGEGRIKKSRESQEKKEEPQPVPANREARTVAVEGTGEKPENKVSPEHHTQARTESGTATIFLPEASTASRPPTRLAITLDSDDEEGGDEGEKEEKEDKQDNVKGLTEEPVSGQKERRVSFSESPSTITLPSEAAEKRRRRKANKAEAKRAADEAAEFKKAVDLAAKLDAQEALASSEFSGVTSLEGARTFPDPEPEPQWEVVRHGAASRPEKKIVTSDEVKANKKIQNTRTEDRKGRSKAQGKQSRDSKDDIRSRSLESKKRVIKQNKQQKTKPVTFIEQSRTTTDGTTADDTTDRPGKSKKPAGHKQSSLGVVDGTESTNSSKGKKGKESGAQREVEKGHTQPQQLEHLPTYDRLTSLNVVSVKDFENSLIGTI